MKKYFAKWLPVEGSILENDLFMANGKYPILNHLVPYVRDEDYEDQDDNTETLYKLAAEFSDKPQKVELFICTRDILPDDEVINVFGHASLWLTGIYVSESDLEDTCYIQTEKGDEQCVKSHWVKIIGKLSDAAIWVKEGDEFGEDEIKVEIERVGKKAKYIEIGDGVIVSYGSSFFHIEGVVKDIVPEQIDSWEWNDRFIITNARKQIGIEDKGFVYKNDISYIYEDIEDFETTRAMVSYPDKKVAVVRVTCSQCKTFH